MDIDKTIEKLREKLEPTNSSGTEKYQGWHWLAGLVSAVVVSLTIWYLKNELAKRDAALVEARHKRELEKLDALHEQWDAQDVDRGEESAQFETAAQERVLRAELKLAELRVQEEAHAARVAALNKIQDWVALNKKAGVK